MHLARALASDAEFVILDEPDASLDSEGRRLLKDILTELATTRRVLVVAHDDSVAPEHVVRIVCRAGVIREAKERVIAPEKALSPV